MIDITASLNNRTGDRFYRKIQTILACFIAENVTVCEKHIVAYYLEHQLNRAALTVCLLIVWKPDPMIPTTLQIEFRYHSVPT